MNQELSVCHRSLAENSKSFSLAAKLFPAAKRDAAAVVYAWCRRADDAIDNGASGSLAQSPRQALGRLRQELDSMYRGIPQADPVLRQFQAVVLHFGVPRRYADELLDGMQMDVAGGRYQSIDELRLYCYRVASTVGLMLCHVMGVQDDAALRHAADLGIAMQLTNIARDVEEDWTRGRLYLPSEILRELGYHGGIDLAVPIGRGSALEGALAAATTRVVQLSESYYASGDAGLRYLPFRDALAVAVARQVYADIGRIIVARGSQPLAPRAVVSLPRKLWLMGKGMFVALGSRLQSRGADERLPSSGPMGLEPGNDG